MLFYNFIVMKRFFAAAIVAAISLIGAHKASAGIFGDGFGVTAGANFSTLTGLDNISMKSAAGFNVGVAYDFKIPVPMFPIHIQPTLTYSMKSADIGDGLLNTDFSVGYLELMASVQPSFDLVLARVFLDISPFVGYGLHGTGDLKELWGKDVMNKLEYGLGVGAGLKIWKIQALARYSWNFGSLANTSETMDDGFGTLDAYRTIKKANFGGVTVSLAYFF